MLYCVSNWSHSIPTSLLKGSVCLGVLCHLCSCCFCRQSETVARSGALPCASHARLPPCARRARPPRRLKHTGRPAGTGGRAASPARRRARRLRRGLCRGAVSRRWVTGSLSCDSIVGPPDKLTEGVFALEMCSECRELESVVGRRGRRAQQQGRTGLDMRAEMKRLKSRVGLINYTRTLCGVT